MNNSKTEYSIKYILIYKSYGTYTRKSKKETKPALLAGESGCTPSILYPNVSHPSNL